MRVRCEPSLPSVRAPPRPAQRHSVRGGGQEKHQHVRHRRLGERNPQPSRSRRYVQGTVAVVEGVEEQPPLGGRIVCDGAVQQRLGQSCAESMPHRACFMMEGMPKALHDVGA